jgi:hypothetical protein
MIKQTTVKSTKEWRFALEPSWCFLLHETVSADKGTGGIWGQCFPVAAENGLTKIQGFWDTLQKTFGSYTRRVLRHTRPFPRNTCKTSGTTL